MATLDKKTNMWRADVHIDGKRYRKRGFSSKKYALLWEAQIRQKHERKELSLEYEESIEIEKLMEKYLDCMEKDQAQNTIISKRATLGKWLRMFKKNYILYTSEIEAQKNFDEMCIGIKPSTANKYLADIVTMFKFGVENGLVNKNPWLDIKKLKTPGEKSPRYLSLEELRVIEGEANGWVKNMVSILARTGLRISELLTMELKNYRDGRIVLDAEKTKGNYGRVVPAGGAREIIEELFWSAKEDGRQLLIANNSNKISRKTASQSFQRLIEKCRKKYNMPLENINLHTLRKTYISHLIMAGEDPIKVMQIVGHKDYSVMKKYLALSQDYLDNLKQLPY